MYMCVVYHCNSAASLHYIVHINHLTSIFYGTAVMYDSAEYNNSLFYHSEQALERKLEQMCAVSISLGNNQEYTKLIKGPFSSCFGWFDRIT